MFVGDEVRLELNFATARARLAMLAYSSLIKASERAYGDGFAGLARVGPLGPVFGLSRLVDVHVLDMVTRDETAVLTLRWEAVGPGGRLFPALDADLTLTPAGEEASTLSLAGAYRPPLAAVGAALDKAILHRVAAATIRSLLNHVADCLADPGRAAEGAPGVKSAASGCTTAGLRSFRPTSEMA